MHLDQWNAHQHVPGPHCKATKDNPNAHEDEVREDISAYSGIVLIILGIKEIDRQPNDGQCCNIHHGGNAIAHLVCTSIIENYGKNTKKIKKVRKRMYLQCVCKS